MAEAWKDLWKSPLPDLGDQGKAVECKFANGQVVAGHLMLEGWFMKDHEIPIVTVEDAVGVVHAFVDFAQWRFVESHTSWDRIKSGIVPS